MNPTERMNVHQLLRHSFITGDSCEKNDLRQGSERNIMKYSSIVSNKFGETNKNNEALLNKNSTAVQIPKSPEIQIKQEEIYISGLSKKNSSREKDEEAKKSIEVKKKSKV